MFKLNSKQTKTKQMKNKKRKCRIRLGTRTFWILSNSQIRCICGCIFPYFRLYILTCIFHWESAHSLGCQGDRQRFGFRCRYRYTYTL